MLFLKALGRENSMTHSFFEIVANLFTIISFVIVFFGISGNIFDYLPILGPFINTFLFKVIAIITFVIIAFKYYLYGIGIAAHYRLSNNSSSLDLKIDDLKQECGDSILLSIKNDVGLFVSILANFGFNLCVEIVYPAGISITQDRETSDFSEVDRKPKRLVLAKKADTEGRRKVRIDLLLDNGSTFAGDYPIYIYIYICRSIVASNHFLPLIRGRKELIEVKIV